MKVHFTRRATRQLDVIPGPLATRSPAGATNVARRVSEVARMLAEHPFIGRSTARIGIRRVAPVPYPYVIDYRVDEGEVAILGVRHTSRRPLP